MKKYIKIFLILIAFFIVTIPVTNILAECKVGESCPLESSGVDAANQIKESDDLDICPQCTTVWAAGAQAVRFTLVNKTDGLRVPGTISIDFSNQYENTKFFNQVWFNGYNSKLDYLGGKSMSFQSGYSVQKPIGPMPNLVGENSSKVGDMNAYLQSTFVIFDGNPTNLVKLFNAVKGSSSQVQKFLDYIENQFAAYDEWNMKAEMSAANWEQLINDYQFAFIVEPVIYLRARTNELKPDYLIVSNKSQYYGKLFAVTPTEAAKIFPSNADDCRAGVCKLVTHSMLPNSIYLEGTVEAIYFSGVRSQYSYAEKFGDANGTYLTFLQNKTTLTPYNLKFDVVGDVGNSPGLGIGYFDLLTLIKDRCDDSCCGSNCDPDPDVPVCEVTPINKPDTPSCRVGSCGTTQSFVDDLKWENINGDEDHLDSALGSTYLVTDWTANNDILKYSTLSCNATRLSPVFCKQTATSSFPTTPDSKFFAGTHFTFSPIKFDIKKDCYTEIELDVWEKDYLETKDRLEVAEESLFRATLMNNFWKGIKSSTYTSKDNPSNIKLNGITGSLSGGTYCSLEWQPQGDIAVSTKTDYTCSYNGITASNTSPTVVSGGTSTKPSATGQSKIVFNGVTKKCTYYDSERDIIFDGDGQITGFNGYKWVESSTGNATVTKTYSCTSGGNTLTTGEAGGTQTYGDTNLPGATKLTISGTTCSVQKTVGVGDKWNNWSYIFDPISLGFDQFGSNKASYFVTSAWEKTPEKYQALCKTGGDYQDVINKYQAAVTYYTKRLADLKTKLTEAMEWEVTNKAPFVSSTHKQNTVAGQIQKTYNLSASGTDVYPSTLTRISCNSDLCKRVKGLSGLTTVYASIYGSRETIYTYSLPSGTNRYILKPSGQVASSLTGGYLASGNYLDIGYANYYIASNSVNGMGSGSITLNYSGLGQNNYFDKACSYTSYSCSYTGVYEKGFDYVYRTIDLDNPFPFNDGTSRQPGYNWRTDPTIINKVITNNRGVKTEEVYKQEPMYSFDFTGANQKKLQQIKTYNKTHSFNEYDLTCIKGHSCTSNFLDTDLLKNVISGCGADGNVSSCYGGGN